MGGPQPTLNDNSSLTCLSNVFVLDPDGRVVVDFEEAIAEADETSNREDF